MGAITHPLETDKIMTKQKIENKLATIEKSMDYCNEMLKNGGGSYYIGKLLTLNGLYAKYETMLEGYKK